MVRRRILALDILSFPGNGGRWKGGCSFTNCTTPSSVMAVTPHSEIEVRLGPHLAREIWSNPASVIRQPHRPFELHALIHKVRRKQLNAYASCRTDDVFFNYTPSSDISKRPGF
jgi:hypothetical protein